MSQKPLSKKIVRQGFQPPTGKNPRGGSKVEQANLAPISWHFSCIDTDGPWSFKNIDSNMLWNQIVPKIKAFEGKSWTQIFQTGRDHPIEIAKIIPEAQMRFEKQFGALDADQLVSLHIDGLKRIWGLKEGSIFKVLWWDPNHDIYPSRKK
jgi:hypothetical protein